MPHGLFVCLFVRLFVCLFVCLFLSFFGFFFFFFFFFFLLLQRPSKPGPRLTWFSEYGFCSQYSN